MEEWPKTHNNNGLFYFCSKYIWMNIFLSIYSFALQIVYTLCKYLLTLEAFFREEEN
jgi:hypothetical protein